MWENSKKIIEHWRNVLKYELWILHTNKNNKFCFIIRIFLEKAFLYKYVGNKIVKKDNRKEIYEVNKKLLTLWSAEIANSMTCCNTSSYTKKKATYCKSIPKWWVKYISEKWFNSFEELNEKHAPENFQYKKAENSITYFNLLFDDTTNLTRVLEAIKISQTLHV